VSQHRIDQWAAVLADSYLIVRVDPPGRTADVLDTAMERHSLGVFVALDGAGDPGVHSVWQPGGPLDPANTIAMMVIESGRAVVEYEQRSFAVVPGDVVFWDGGVPLALDVTETVRRRILLFPRASAVRFCPRHETLLGRAIAGRGELIGTLFEVVDLLRPRLGEMAVTVRQAAANLLVQLVSGLDPEAGRPDSEPLLEAILRYIDDHLGDADLRPARIAAAHNISVRTLYLLFVEVGSPVSAYIRQRRLSRSYHDVLQGDGESMGVIARRWGFANAAQFSRLFRERYGIPPSRLRGLRNVPAKML
jgi:AraC-like DNA-binding protein